MFCCDAWHFIRLFSLKLEIRLGLCFFFQKSWDCTHVQTFSNINICQTVSSLQLKDKNKTHQKNELKFIVKKNHAMDLYSFLLGIFNGTLLKFSDCIREKWKICFERQILPCLISTKKTKRKKKNFTNEHEHGTKSSNKL